MEWYRLANKTPYWSLTEWVESSGIIPLAAAVLELVAFIPDAQKNLLNKPNVVMEGKKERNKS